MDNKLHTAREKMVACLRIRETMLYLENKHYAQSYSHPPRKVQFFSKCLAELYIFIEQQSHDHDMHFKHFFILVFKKSVELKE